MKKQATTVKRATKDLEARKDRDVKGGFLANSSHTSMSETGEALKAVAQK